ncbi:MAG: hypothetical protein ACFB0A_12755 [Croceivirga sp.]
MKKELTVIIVTVISFLYGNAQDNCSAYFPMIEGASYEYQMFSKKGKLEGTSAYTVGSVDDDGGNTYATMQVAFTDAKGKSAYESDYKITCTGDGVKIDFESLFPKQMMEQYEGMEVEMDITGTDIEIPNNLSVGQQLADANINISMNMGAMNMKIEVNTTDRQVVGQESVTTSAGTFDCYVISANTSSKMMMAKHQMSDKLWLSKRVGIVKQDTYSKNGKLESRMQLEKFSK